MPFKSEKQRRYLYAKEPGVAKKFAAEARKKAIERRMKKNGNKHS